MSVEHLSNQIRLMNRAVKRDLSTDPSLNDWLVQRLAQLLDGAGTTSTLDLVYFADQATNLSFFYDQRTGHVFESGANVNDATYNAGTNGGNLFTILSRDGRENDRIYLFFTKDGYPVFWNVSQDNGSDWADVRTGLIFVGSIVLSAVGVPIASTIGSAVLGAEMAVAYPALAQGIGQAVISTLMNGGDIEKGAVSAVASYVGAGVGSEVASATTSDMLGQATAAATRAYINGGNIDTAVAQSLLQNGITSMQSVLLSGFDDTADFAIDGTDAFDFSSFDDTAALPDFGGYSSADLSAIGDLQMGQYYTDENGITYGVDAQGDLAVVDFVDDQGIGYATDVDGDLMVVDAPTSADISQTLPTTDSNGTVAITAGSNSIGANVLSSLATTALSLVTSYVKAGAPTIRTGTASATVNANGTITTRNANGTVTTTKPAAGTPYLSASGALVTNNGDGTYTTVSPSGQISTRSYSAPAAAAGSIAGIPPAVLYGGAALLAVALLRK